jgi:hypothetical protein
VNTNRPRTGCASEAKLVLGEEDNGEKSTYKESTRSRQRLSVLEHLYTTYVHSRKLQACKEKNQVRKGELNFVVSADSQPGMESHTVGIWRQRAVENALVAIRIVKPRIKNQKCGGLESILKYPAITQ